MGILDQFFKSPAPSTTVTTPPVVLPPANAPDPNAKVDPNAPVKPNTDPSAVPDTPPAADPNNPDLTRTQPNPLDVYKKVLDNANKPEDNVAPSFSIDDKTMSEVAAGLDFTQGIDKELVQKALDGDAGSVMEFVKLTSANAYKTALQHSTKLTESHLGQRSTYEEKRTAAQVKTGLTQNSLSSVANYDHPVAKAELNRVAADLAKQHPDQTPAQIAKAAQEYLQTLAEAIKNPDSVVDGAGLDSTGKPKEFDYHAYLTSNEQ